MRDQQNLLRTSLVGRYSLVFENWWTLVYLLMAVVPDGYTSDLLKLYGTSFSHLLKSGLIRSNIF